MDEQLEVRTPIRRPDPVLSPPPRRRQRWTWLIGLLILAGTGLIAWRLLESRPQPNATARNGGPPQPVGVATIGVGDMNVVLTGLGAVTHSPP